MAEAETQSIFDSPPDATNEARLDAEADVAAGCVVPRGARKLAEKEAREGPVDPAYARRQAAAWDLQAQKTARAAEQALEAERAPRRSGSAGG